MKIKIEKKTLETFVFLVVVENLIPKKRLLPKKILYTLHNLIQLQIDTKHVSNPTIHHRFHPLHIQQVIL
jgi:hypothetical protein